LRWEKEEARQGSMRVPESFETLRLKGQRLAPDHLSDLLELHRDRRVMLELGGVRDEAETSRYLERNLEHWAEHGFGVWMLRDREDSRSVGRVVLRWLHLDELDDVEIGFALLPEFWGCGVATEAADCCLRLARSALDLKTLIGAATPSNYASQRVLTKLGLRRDSEVSINGTRYLLYRIRW
jgi:ribosomal-protein-alanine N-acetyltransferase